MDPMIAIRETFFQECEEQLAALEAGLLEMESGATDSETVNAVFRAVHSIKGGAGAFGLDDLVRFSHVFETVLDDVRAGKLSPDGRLMNVMLRAADALADLVRFSRDGGTANAERNAEITTELAALSGKTAPGAASASSLSSSPADAPFVDDGIADFAFQPLGVDLTELQPAGAHTWTIFFRPKAELYTKANETSVLFRELSRLGHLSAEVHTTDLPSLSELDPEGAYLAWTISLTTAEPEGAIREVFEFVDEDCDLTIEPLVLPQDSEAPDGDGFDLEAILRQAKQEPTSTGTTTGSAPPLAKSEQVENTVAEGTDTRVRPAEAPSTPRATIRVDLDRVDRLIDLVGELVINQAMLAQRVSEAGLTRSSNVALGLGDLEQLTREIQDSVMAIRAQPVKSVFQRIPRLVREVSALTGKPVRLVTEGEGTEVDKTVIEHLADPLTHMIRNAIDHGLESPTQRATAGKPAEGTVRLSARHRSGRIVIEVADDGGGINRPRVRSIAVEKGLIGQDASLSDEEIDNLIFLPGFSTADTVSDISGRGVGMDVVKRSIQALGGRISIGSRPGQGSTFTMSLPLTLAVLDGMVVSVAAQTLVAPLTAIVETLQSKPGDVHSLGRGVMLIAIRGTYIPLIDVGLALGYREEPLDPAVGVTLLIEGESGARAALLVDAIQGQRQVVIKSLEANYRRVMGVAAATILGDGRVALILDVDALVSASRGFAGPVRTEPTPITGYAYA